ncbi:MAG: hypothetical protein JWQ18_1633 [Conexibacter sp.]|nr:hypothetical protein [Conexibacter sp.]
MNDTTSTPYFGDIDEVWDELSARHRAAITEVRGVLTRLGLPFARPEDATTTYDPANEAVHLKIRHRTDATIVAVLLFADQVALHWPGGRLTKPECDRELLDALEAMLGGTNVIRTWTHASKVIAVDTEIWLPSRLRRALPRLDAPGTRARILRRLPWPARRTDATLSYARRPALAPPAERDRL